MLYKEPSQVALGVKNLPTMQEMQEIRVQPLGWEIPWSQKWHLLQHCLESSMDRGAWWAAFHGITKSRT